MLGRMLGCVATIVIALTATACSASTPTASATVATAVTIATEHCGAGWMTPRSGQQTFVLTNRDIVAGEAFLVNGEGDVVAYVDNVGPGASADLRLDLGSGRYGFRCAMSDSDVADGPMVSIPGHAKGGTFPVRAVTTNDLLPVVKAYQSFVERALPKLETGVEKLDRDIHAGNLHRARLDWLPAHLAYERLGAAYGAFGEMDAAINGTASGLPRGASDPGFTGFHRIEYGLWHDQTAATLSPVADRLDRDVSQLKHSFASARIQPLDIGIRAHEIAENALQFELTGQTDYGSNSNLATVEANLQGTATVLAMLHGVIAPRYPALAVTTAELAKATSDARLVQSRPLSSLSTAEHEKLDADLSELTELLAPIASICEPRRDS